MAFEYLEQHSTFDSVEDMDTAVELHIQQHYFNLTESERAIVFVLASRSLAYPGASHLKAETIANQIGLSTKTVYRSVKKLADLCIIEKVPGTKLNGIKGASIYRILPYVLSSVSQRETVKEVSNDAVSEHKFEKQSSNSFNLFSFKTSSIYDVYSNAHAEKEACKDWMNEYQKMLYDFLYSLPMADQLKDELHKIVLASDIENVQDFHKAKDVFMSLVMDIKTGVLTVGSTIRAVFKGAYDKALRRRSYSIKDQPVKVDRKAPDFYNWLEERESYKQVTNNYRPIENWLEW